MGWEAKIQHNARDGQFKIDHDGDQSVADYYREGSVITFTHTFVPPELRGQGVAAALVRSALAFARQEGLKVRPECAYFARYMQSHADTQDLLAR